MITKNDQQMNSLVQQIQILKTKVADQDQEIAILKLLNKQNEKNQKKRKNSPWSQITNTRNSQPILKLNINKKNISSTIDCLNISKPFQAFHRSLNVEKKETKRINNLIIPKNKSLKNALYMSKNHRLKRKKRLKRPSNVKISKEFQKS